MARNNQGESPRQDSAVRSFSDPIHLALREFWTYCDSSWADEVDVVGSEFAYSTSIFAREGGTIDCLFDLAYVWLREGTGARACPTFESWLVFLLAFADEVHRFREGSVIPGWIEVLTEHAVPGATLSRLDLFYWGRGANSNREADMMLDRSDEEGFRHPALRSDVYELHRSQYVQHHNIRN